MTEPKAIEPRSAFVWNIIDAVQVVGAIVAAALAGVSEPAVYALLAGAIIRKVWPIVEAVRAAAVKARRPLMVAMVAMQVPPVLGHLTGCVTLPPPTGDHLKVIIEDDPERPGGCLAWLELDGRPVTHKARAADCGPRKGP